MQDIEHFKQMIWAFYQMNGRTFAWRQTKDPYHIFVSEIMLQQTQTYRVEPKYEVFMQVFPTVADLAQASLRDVLGLWQGLGYNRRGKALWENAQRIMHEFAGRIPDEPAILQTFSHIGPNTAGSIAAFAYNKPVVFIETNIRAVYLHHFFKEQEAVKDLQLLPFIERSLDHERPREWYYALMDYGVQLKKSLPNPSRKSAHHTVQSKFEGSDRQIRGKIIRQLTRHEKVDEGMLFQSISCEQERYKRILAELCAEGMVKESSGFFFL